MNSVSKIDARWDDVEDLAWDDVDDLARIASMDKANKSIVISSLRRFLKTHSPEDVQKIVNDLIAENIINK